MSQDKLKIGQPLPQQAKGMLPLCELQSAHLKFSDPKTVQLLAQELIKQSQIVAFVNVYQFIVWSFIFMIPFIFLIKKTVRPAGAKLHISE